MADTTTNYNDDIIVEDGENYNSNQMISIKTITLEQFRRCCTEASKARENYSDQKEIFTLCIETLQVILSPKLSEFDELKKKLTELDNKLNQIKTELQEEVIKNGSKTRIEQLQRLNDPLRLGLYQEKFLVLSELLARINYFDEMSGVFKFD